VTSTTWLSLLADSFGALNRPLTGAVDTEEWNAPLFSNTCNLLDEASRWLLIAHNIHGPPHHQVKAEEADLHLSLDLVFGEFLEDSCKTVTSAINNDINSIKLFNSKPKGRADIGLVDNIELQWKAILRSVSGRMCEWIIKGLTFSDLPLDDNDSA